MSLLRSLCATSIKAKLQVFFSLSEQSGEKKLQELLKSKQWQRDAEHEGAEGGCPIEQPSSQR